MFKWLGGLVDSNEKEIKRLQPLVDKINELEPEFERLSNDELKAKTGEFKDELKNGASLDDILPEVFAVVREAGRLGELYGRIRRVGVDGADVQAEIRRDLLKIETNDAGKMFIGYKRRRR